MFLQTYAIYSQVNITKCIESKTILCKTIVRKKTGGVTKTNKLYISHLLYKITKIVTYYKYEVSIFTYCAIKESKILQNNYICIIKVLNNIIYIKKL